VRIATRPSLFDIALAAALVVLAISEVTFNHALAPRAGSYPIEIALAAAVAWRRAAPLAAATIIAIGGVADAAIGVSPSDPSIPMMTTVAVAYALVAHSPLRQAIVGSVILIAGTTAQVVVAGQNISNLGFAFTFLAVIWAIGRLVRLRTAQAVRAEVQVERLRNEQAERARTVAAAERARIARELHDVIAHSVSVMVVQAGAAQQVLRADPTAAERALGSVQSTGRQAIGELGQLLGVLREGGAELGLAPQPTLAELPALIADAESAGVPATFTTRGIPRPLPAGIELAVYRIVQEALTNTRKHAGGHARASVRLDYGTDDIVLDISDDGHATTEPHHVANGTGHGLIGMRERISTYGGTLTAGPSGARGFRVHARIPVHAAD
jgi:signal transduction histidine kinase